MMNITYGEFYKHMSEIKKIVELQDVISDVCSEAHRDKFECEFMFPTLETNVIELLGKLTNDTDDLIGYWVYELDCGKDYYDGAITDNDKDIKLRTINDLWNALRETDKKHKDNVKND